MYCTGRVCPIPLTYLQRPSALVGLHGSAWGRMHGDCDQQESCIYHQSRCGATTPQLVNSLDRGDTACMQHRFFSHINCTQQSTHMPLLAASHLSRATSCASLLDVRTLLLLSEPAARMQRATPAPGHGFGPIPTPVMYITDGGGIRGMARPGRILDVITTLEL